MMRHSFQEIAKHEASEMDRIKVVGKSSGPQAKSQTPVQLHPRDVQDAVKTIPGCNKSPTLVGLEPGLHDRRLDLS